MNKIGIRIIILILLVGAVIYIANFKYKAVQKNFFVEGAELINESLYVILDEKGDTLFTETLEIQKGLYQIYYESKKFVYHSDNISEAFRLVSDTSGNLLWGSYEKFESVKKDSINRVFALYSTFQPELMRTLPVVGWRNMKKTDIDLTKDYLIFNGLYTSLNSYQFNKKTKQLNYEFITLDSVNYSYKLSELSAFYTEPDSSNKFKWNLLDDNSDSLLTIIGIPYSNSFNLIIDHKNKLRIKRVYGRDYQYKVLNQQNVKKPDGKIK